MKLSIIGAGTMGSALARELAEMEDVSEVVICDAHTRTLQQLDRLVDSPKLSPFQIDARDIRSLLPIVRGSGCIVGASSPALNFSLAELAIEVGSHFCDLGGGDGLAGRLEELDQKASEKGVWIVPNCGLDPGLANILCLLAISHFDAAQSAWIRVGDVPLEPNPPFNFRISWSAEKLIHDYSAPVIHIQDGRKETSRPLENLEGIAFPEPFDNMEAFSTARDLEPIWNATEQTLTSLDHKAIRWPGHANQMRFLLGLGFAEERIIDVRTHLTYRDVLVRRLRQRLGGDHKDAVLLRVGVTGTVDGTVRTMTYELIHRYDDETGVTAVQKCTGVPAALISTALAQGEFEGGGARPPEALISGLDFLDRIRSRGLDVKESWADGEAPPSQP